MLVFVIIRLLQAIPVLLAVLGLAFVLFAYVGDPATMLLGQDHTADQRLTLIRQLGLDQPVPVQFVHYVRTVLHGDFGVSYRAGMPVAALIADRAPATLELVATALVLALSVGIPLGIATAVRPASILSRALMVVSLAGISLPVFLLGLLLILAFSVSLPWLPSFGRGPVTPVGPWWTTGFTSWDGLRALVLPAITLGLFQMTLIMRLVRAEMLDVLRADYIRFARARGLRARSILFTHALRNTLVPVITIVALQLGAMIAFAMVTETVFQWPGLGLLLVQSVAAADLPVLSAYLLMIAVLFTAINLGADLLNGVVDPRLRIKGRSP